MKTTQHKVIHLNRDDAKPNLGLESYFDIDRKIAKPGFRLPDGGYNWHCTCVSPYITGPCGYFFRNFMQNVDNFVGESEPMQEKENRHLFKKIHVELMGCLNTYPVYYKSFIDEFGTPSEHFADNIK